MNQIWDRSLCSIRKITIYSLDFVKADHSVYLQEYMNLNKIKDKQTYSIKIKYLIIQY